MRTTKCILALLVMFAVACGAASADKNDVSIAISAGIFAPIDSTIKDEFGNFYGRVSFKTFEATRPQEWRFTAEVAGFMLESSDLASGGTKKARFIPVTAGMERGLGEYRRFQPYVTIRGGPYFGRFQDTALDLNDRSVGLNVNVSLGTIVLRRMYVEGRYDYFSSLSGHNFDGFSISAGLRLFDIRF